MKLDPSSTQTGSAAKAVPVSGFATCDVIAKMAKKHCGLGSREIEAVYDENADLKAACTGSIYVGVFRRVGRFRVLDDINRSPDA